MCAHVFEKCVKSVHACECTCVFECAPVSVCGCVCVCVCACVCVWVSAGKRSGLVTVSSVSYGPDQPPQRSKVEGLGVEASQPITVQCGVIGLTMLTEKGGLQCALLCKSL